MAEVHVKGLAELEQFLQTLPDKLQKNVLRGALRAGANVVLEQAKLDCPVGDPSARGKRLYGHYRGALRDSLRIKTGVKGGKIFASVVVGGKTKKGANVFYAHFVELTGATAHVLQGKDYAIGGRVYKRLDHPGMHAKPFLRPALHNKAAPAVVAAAEYIKKRLAGRKIGLDTSDISIEAEA